MNRIRILRSTLILYIKGQSRTKQFNQVLKKIKEKGKSWEETEKERL
jgi:hypothetical protein